MCSVSGLALHDNSVVDGGIVVPAHVLDEHPEVRDAIAQHSHKRVFQQTDDSTGTKDESTQRDFVGLFVSSEVLHSDKILETLGLCDNFVVDGGVIVPAHVLDEHPQIDDDLALIKHGCLFWQRGHYVKRGFKAVTQDSVQQQQQQDALANKGAEKCACCGVHPDAAVRTTESSGRDEEKFVYVCATGSRYHTRVGCHGANNKVSLAEAEELGHTTKCKHCLADALRQQG